MHSFYVDKSLNKLDMKGFLKIFFACFLALIIFCVVGVLLLLGIAAASTAESKPDIGKDGVLVLDLSKYYKEQSQENFSFNIGGGMGSKNDVPGLSEVVNAIEYAKADANINMLYIKSDNSVNGMASSDELRKAIADFKRSKKMVLAYGKVISQKSY